MPENEQKEQFIKVMRANKGIIFKICNSYCAKKEERDDLSQEIVYELWKSFPSFKPEYRFTTWMYRIALNVAITFYRKGKRSPSYFSLNDNLLELVYEPPDHDENEQQFQQMHLFISELKEIDKSIIILYLEDKSYREIATITGITETNVSTRINRIKEILKNKFLNN